MKKSLLIASALLCAASAVAQQEIPVGKDPNTYENKTSGDVTFTLNNRWLYANTLNGFGGTPGAKQFSWAGPGNRTAVVFGDDVLISDNTMGGFHKFGFINGEYKGFTKYSLEGVEDLGIAYTNQIGLDDFGHVYVVGYVADLAKTPIVLRTLDVNTGVLTEVGSIDCRGESFNAAARIDYCQIIGDITGKEAKAQFAAAVSNATDKAVVRATLEQNSDEWVGAFGGYFTWESANIVTYPADKASWGAGSLATMIKDEDFSGNLFYVDGNNTCPTLYDMEGSIAGSFADCPDIAPDAAPTGVAEVSVAGKNFVIYVMSQYTPAPAPNGFCRIRVGCFGESTEYSDLQEFWTVPTPEGKIEGLGTQSDGGIRYHHIQAVNISDKNGKEGAYILDFKCRNGLGVYVLAEEGFDDPNGGVEGVEIDEENNAAPVYYNLNGIQVDKPANGLYIVKRGNKVTKEIL